MLLHLSTELVRARMRPAGQEGGTLLTGVPSAPAGRLATLVFPDDHPLYLEGLHARGGRGRPQGDSPLIDAAMRSQGPPALSITQ
jgi:hypothetical protein